MLPTEVRVGWVFHYAYLWDWQHREGREEGDKDRPCLVLAIVLTTEDGQPMVRVLPITHTPPDDPADAIEIKNRLRLDDERSWIILTESNRFVWPGWDLRAVDSESGYYGALTPGLFAEVKRDRPRRGRDRAAPERGAQEIMQSCITINGKLVELRTSQ